MKRHASERFSRGIERGGTSGGRPAVGGAVVLRGRCAGPRRDPHHHRRAQRVRVRGRASRGGRGLLLGPPNVRLGSEAFLPVVIFAVRSSVAAHGTRVAPTRGRVDPSLGPPRGRRGRAVYAPRGPPRGRGGGLAVAPHGFRRAARTTGRSPTAPAMFRRPDRVTPTRAARPRAAAARALKAAREERPCTAAPRGLARDHPASSDARTRGREALSLCVPRRS